MSFENEPVTIETITERNARITAALQAGMLPILPFERIILERQLDVVKAEQDQMGKELGEVNHQGSETWHDNFAANQIEWHSRIVSNRGSRLVETIDGSIECDFPPEGDEVTMGSILELKFPGAPASEIALLTGRVMVIDDDIELGLPDGYSVITLKSPVGQVLLGARPGEAVSYQVNGKDRSVEILGVSQLRPFDQ